MLSIMRAIWKWRVDLLGSHINIYTDHKTLQNFDYQRDLSQYEYTITYIDGDLNMVADALSQLPHTISTDSREVKVDVVSVFSIESDPKLIWRVKKGYRHDSWCKSILKDLKKNVIDEKLEITFKN